MMRLVQLMMRLVPGTGIGVRDGHFPLSFPLMEQEAPTLTRGLANQSRAAGSASPSAWQPTAAAKDPQKGGPGAGAGTAVITRTKTQTRRPSMYRVLLLNDDYTPMEFVVAVLKKYFNKGPEEATRIMLHVHQHGVGECGIFTYEVAETKVTQVMDYARKHQHPLQCIMEKK
jgi:ATP-dependent Clp protease adaptor protein ClpS